jgi:uncharacterized protein (TIGR02246 family)
VLAWGLLGMVASANAQAQPAAARPAEAEAPASERPLLTDRPEEERAIRSAAAAFKRVYDAGDSRAAAGFFLEDGEIIDEEGERVQGRASIQDVFAEMFRDRPGTTIEFTPATLRFFGPEAAKEEGQTRLKPIGNEESARVRRYTVLLVKQAGKWLFSSVREEHEPALSHHERLKDLEWLIGEWVDESAASTIHADCRWSDDQNFILRDFTIHVQGKPAMTVTQRIGWDPLTKQVKSWVFDSEGGYGESLWTHNGNQWLIKSTGVLPDGRIATATNVLTHVGPHSAKWASIERTVAGHVVPDHEEFVIVRKPPKPQSHSTTRSGTQPR